jgi:hypothetical protein
MIPLPRRAQAVAVDTTRPEVDLVIAAHNQAGELACSVPRLHAFLRGEFPFATRITIADKASTDTTWRVASRLADELPDVRLLRLNASSPGRALAAAWLTSEARVLAYMEADPSADLSVLLPLVAPIISGHSDISIGRRRGDRLHPRGHRWLRLLPPTGIDDDECSFKAVRADVARWLIPSVVDRDQWFDGELLVRAEQAGLRVHELPVFRKDPLHSA